MSDFIRSILGVETSSLDMNIVLIYIVVLFILFIVCVVISKKINIYTRTKDTKLDSKDVKVHD